MKKQKVESPKGVGVSITRRGESRGKRKEEGRHEAGGQGHGRTAGKRTARDRTGVDPQEPIDPRMPHL